MADIRDACVAFTIGREGRWYPGDRPDDPNPTMYGVTQGNYDTYRVAKLQPLQSVQLIAWSEVLDIYDWYGKRSGAYSCPSPLCITVFDMAINGGEVEAAILLQKALGFTGDAVDSVIGPDTLKAVWTQPRNMLIRNYDDQRRAHYQAIVVAEPAKAPDLPEWLARVDLFEKEYLNAVD